MSQGLESGALAGVKVVDFSHFEAGPFASLMLTGLGADVIKIERVGLGDATRMRRPGGPETDASTFRVFNTGKRSIALNLTEPLAVEAAKALIAGADIVLENFSPGALDRLGLGFAVGQALNPRVIYAHICGFRPGSPYANFPAYDGVAQATGGAMSVTGEPAEGAPLRPGVNLGDSGTGMAAALAMVAALYQRERTGLGQEIFVPMEDCILNLMRAPLAMTMDTGAVWPRVGNQVFRYAFKKAPFPGPSDVFKCAGDGPNDYCFVHVLDFTDASYVRLFNIIGEPDLIRDTRFASHAARLENMQALDAAVAAWCVRHPKWEVMAQLAAAGITAGAVSDTAELLTREALLATGSMQELHDIDGRTVRVPSFPAQMLGAVRYGPAPKLGGDTDAVLGSVGYDAAAIAALRAIGAVG